MKKIINIRNITLILVVVLIGVLSLKIKEVKAAGTVTWSGPSSVTIRETLSNVVNPIVAHRAYYLQENFGNYNTVATATINYTASDTYTNYQITKTAVMNLSSLTFTAPGDYEYRIYEDVLYDSNDRYIDNYFYNSNYSYDHFVPYYNAIVQVRNVVDGNNVPTGNFTASLILEKWEYNDQTDDWECSKVSPSSGVLYADYNYEPYPDAFGHIELSKTVKGTGADRNKYFPFTITINNDISIEGLIDSSGWTYPISGLDTTVTYNGSTISNPTSITDGTSTTIYLKHGQTAIIGQVTSGGSSFDAIPAGICSEEEDPFGGDPGGDPIPDPGDIIVDGQPHNQSYDYTTTPRIKPLTYIDNLYCYGSYFRIEEDPADYDASFSVNGGSSTSGYYVPATGIMDINTYSTTATVDFSNTKEMSPFTGLIFTILPYLMLAGIGIGGTLLVMRLKKEERKVKE